ncbi:glycosyltransferase 87 family protein [Flavobacteriaceae bacterium]|nr:glycosyltransferase 87 family protein [Flavobacteriaceae bacterium]MDB4206772.1 glycosyltransferase 87 family protein [Flavobacteriaceae bacterium]
MEFNRSFINSKKTFYLLGSLSILFYAIWAYDLERFEHAKLLGLYSILFGCYYLILKHPNTKERHLSYLAIGLRLIFLVAIPNLSQDFYRFIWDGRLLLAGLNPYLFTPSGLVYSQPDLFPQMKLLFEGMGALSAGHFSNYPPIHQLPFVIAAMLSKYSILGSVIVLRLILIGADLGILFFGKRLLKKLQLPTKKIYWFLLNPLVIIELTGNLHFEGLMLFFFVMALYFIHSKKWHLAALTMALSIAVKLVPILSLPLFLNKLGWKKSIRFYVTIGGGFLLLFLPFLSGDFIKNYSTTIGLWFSKFEFNASIYYALQWVIEKTSDVELIHSMGIIVVSFLGLQIGYQLIQNKSKTTELILMILWVLSGYYFISTTVHPWYIISLLLLSIFTNYKFVRIWSYTLIFSYFAYNQSSVNENGLILCLEYIPVLSVLAWEFFKPQRFKN